MTPPIYYDPNGDGYIDLSRVRTCATNRGNLISHPALTHELGHAYGIGGHYWTFHQEFSIMRHVTSSVERREPRSADKKLAKILYEDSYKHGTGSMIYYSYYDMSILDVLGLWWGISWVSKSQPNKEEIEKFKDKIITECGCDKHKSENLEK